MAVSDSPKRRSFPFSRGVSRYDLVLTLVPLAFLLGGALTLLQSVSPLEGLLVGTVAGSLVTVDALFLNPPVDDG